MSIKAAKNFFIAGIIVMIPFVSYAEENCYAESRSLWGKVAAGTIMVGGIIAIALSAGTATPFIVAGATGASAVAPALGDKLASVALETPKGKEIIAECLKKSNPGIDSSDTVELVKGLLEQGKKNEIKKMEISLSRDDYMKVEGSIGFKFIGASVGYEEQDKNIFVMKAEYK